MNPYPEVSLEYIYSLKSLLKSGSDFVRLRRISGIHTLLRENQRSLCMFVSSLMTPVTERSVFHTKPFDDLFDLRQANFTKKERFGPSCETRVETTVHPDATERKCSSTHTATDWSTGSAFHLVSIKSFTVIASPLDFINDSECRLNTFLCHRIDSDGQINLPAPIAL